MQNILVITENRSFLVRKIVEQLEELRYNIEEVDKFFMKMKFNNTFK